MHEGIYYSSDYILQTAQQRERNTKHSQARVARRLRVARHLRVARLLCVHTKELSIGVGVGVGVGVYLFI
jgi:hypothetical protein